MTEAMIEKVARAIRGLKDNPNADLLLEEFAGWASDEDVALVVTTALAAIQETHAIVPREPTEAMLDVSWNLGDWSDVLEQAKRHEANCEAYTAMISAAEGEGK